MQLRQSLVLRTESSSPIANSRSSGVSSQHDTHTSVEPTQLQRLAQGRDVGRRQVSPIRVNPTKDSETPKPFDVRLHGNVVDIGGKWGTVDLGAAIYGNRSGARSSAYLPRLVPLNEVDERLRTVKQFHEIPSNLDHSGVFDKI
jgi:hypothetical protein